MIYIAATVGTDTLGIYIYMTASVTSSGIIKGGGGGYSNVSETKLWSCS